MLSMYRDNAVMSHNKDSAIGCHRRDIMYILGTMELHTHL